MRLVRESDFRKWLKVFPKEFRLRLIAGMDPARVLSLYELSKDWDGLFDRPQRIAVVSGSSREPELALVPEIASIEILDYEADSDFFDLNRNWGDSMYSHLHSQFDLVLCEQVLEHIPSPELGIKNLSLLLREGGHLHLSVPAINNTHGEPHYFFAGFHTRYLEFACIKSGLRVVKTGSWGSEKAARMYATCDWAPLSESGPGYYFLTRLALGSRDPASVAKSLARRMSNIAVHPFQGLFKIEASSNAVISWITAKKEK